MFDDNSVIAGDTQNGNNEIIYTITATNNSTAETVENVKVDDPIPDGAEFASADTGGKGSYDETTGEWNVGTLATTETATLILTVTVPSSTTGSVTNTATISGANAEPDRRWLQLP